MNAIGIPELLERSAHQTQGAGRHRVVIHNNDTTSYEDVIMILIAATGCDTQEAVIETWEAHTFGQANVHFADGSECEDVALVISSVGVRTEVLPEWND